MTIAGSHTVAELTDLVQAKDYVLAEMQKGYDAFAPTWEAKDKVTQGQWLDAWNTLKMRYGRAKVLANAEIANAKIQPIPSNIIPAETAYNAILSALQKTTGVVSPGDLQDLYNRLNDAGKQVSFNVPQPKASDLDLNTLTVIQKNPLLNFASKNPKSSIAIILAGLGGLGYVALSKGKRP